MSFTETFSAVFLGQALAWFCGWIIKEYIEPKWNWTHKKFKERTKQIFKIK